MTTETKSPRSMFAPGRWYPGKRITFQQVAHDVPVGDGWMPAHQGTLKSGSGTISIALRISPEEVHLIVVPDADKNSEVLLRVPPDVVEDGT